VAFLEIFALIILAGFVISVMGWVLDRPAAVVTIFYVLVGLVWCSGITAHAPEGSIAWWVMLLGKWLAYGLPVWLAFEWWGEWLKNRRRSARLEKEKAARELSKPKNYSDEELRRRIDATIAAHREKL
jgi:type VI protein secretion system component VasK